VFPEKGALGERLSFKEARKALSFKRRWWSSSFAVVDLADVVDIAKQAG